MPTASDEGAVLPIRKTPKKPGGKRVTPPAPPAEREFPVMLSPRLGPARKTKKSKSTIVTFKCPVPLLAAVDACTESMRAYDPMASRAAVLRMALVEFLQPKGFLRGGR